MRIVRYPSVLPAPINCFSESELADSGWAMENQPSICEQSIAGAIATATHGSGEQFSKCLQWRVRLRE